MWNLLYSNKTCNSKNRFRDHKEHIDRIHLAKPMIDTSEPSKPKFFSNGAKKKVMKHETDRKITYENELLYSKMKELHNKPSPYSQSQNVPIRCPAFDHKAVQYRDKRKYLDIYEANQKLRKRFLSAKPTYKTSEYIKDFKHSNVYKENICNKDNNPNLGYATYKQFKKKLTIAIEREEMLTNENDLYVNANYYKMNNNNNDNHSHNISYNNTVNDFRNMSNKKYFNTRIKPAISTKDYSYPKLNKGISERSFNTENNLKRPVSSRPNHNVNMNMIQFDNDYSNMKHDFTEGNVINSNNNNNSNYYTNTNTNNTPMYVGGNRTYVS